MVFGRAKPPGRVAGRHDDEVAELRRAVLTTEGTTSPDARQAAFRGVGVEGLWTSYVAMVRDASYRITDSDVDYLLVGGCTEDAVLEMTLAAALGAASHRLDAGLRLLHGGG